MANDLVARVDDLEAQLAFQEDTIQQLNDAIVAHQERIGRLEKVINLLVDQFRGSEGITTPEEEPPPPHY